MAQGWSSSGVEQNNPIPPRTKCVAIKDFRGEQRNDLPFSRGEVLTIIDPCNVMFWYVAEKSSGQRGVIPITHVKVQAAANKKPPPLPPDSSQPLPHDGLEVAAAASSGHAFTPPLPPKPMAATLDHKTTKAGYVEKTSLTYPRCSPALLSSRSSPNLPNEIAMASGSGGGGVTPPPTFEKPNLLPLNPHEPSQVSNTIKPATSSTPSPATSTASMRYVYNVPAKAPLLKPHNSPCAPSSPVQSIRNQPLPPLPPSPSIGKAIIKTPPTSESVVGGASVGDGGVTLGRQKHVPPIPHAVPSNSATLDIDRRPPAPLPSAVKPVLAPPTMAKSKYSDQKEFVQKSGWFLPSLEHVLCKMMYTTNVSVLTSTTTAIYMFVHKRSPTKKFVAKSRTAYHDLVQMFHRLYDKKNEKLSSLEREIKYNSPDSSDWVFRIYSVTSSDLLEAEASMRILENNTMQPCGMNTAIEFSSKESFMKFAESYAQSLRESAKKCVNPLRAAK